MSTNPSLEQLPQILPGTNLPVHEPNFAQATISDGCSPYQADYAIWLPGEDTLGAMALVERGTAVKTDNRGDVHLFMNADCLWNLGSVATYLGLTYDVAEEPQADIKAHYLTFPSATQANQKIQQINQWLIDNDCQESYGLLPLMDSFEGGTYRAEDILRSVANGRFLMADGQADVQIRDKDGATAAHQAAHDAVQHMGYVILAGKTFWTTATIGAREALEDAANDITPVIPIGRRARAYDTFMYDGSLGQYIIGQMEHGDEMDDKIVDTITTRHNKDSESEQHVTAYMVTRDAFEMFGVVRTAINQITLAA